MHSLFGATKISYNFKSFDLRSIILSANGVVVPGFQLKIKDGHVLWAA